MTDAEKAVWGVVGALVTAFIIGTVKFIRSLREGRIVVEGNLAVCGDIAVIQAIGCAGLMLTVTSRAKRQAKVGKASLNLKGFNAMPAFQQAFGSDFGYRPPGGQPDETFCVELLPFSERKHPEGYVLDRDDVCRFFLPIQIPALPAFVEAPSEDVTITIRFFDGTETTLLQGLRVQTEIEMLIAAWGNARQACKVPVNITVHVTSTTPASFAAAEMVGKVNPHPATLWKSKDRTGDA